jgi:hypothetical protein
MRVYALHNQVCRQHILHSKFQQKNANARIEQPKCQGINFEPTAGLARGKGTNRGTFMLVCHIGTLEKK